MAHNIADDNTPYKRLVEQDEGDVPNADAGGQNLFIDTADNKLKRKDSAGDVAEVEGGGISSGTSFPGSPSTDDLFFRTDRGILYYYDGTRWLSVQIFRDSFTNSENTNPTTTNGAVMGAWPATQGDNGIFVLAVEATTLVLTTNDGSNYWTVTYSWRTQTNTNNTLTSFNTSGDTHTNWYDKSGAVNAVLDSTARYLHAIVTKTGSPGSLYIYPCIKYRLIG